MRNPVFRDILEENNEDDEEDDDEDEGAPNRRNALQSHLRVGNRLIASDTEAIQNEEAAIANSKKKAIMILFKQSRGYKRFQME